MTGTTRHAKNRRASVKGRPRERSLWVKGKSGVPYPSLFACPTAVAHMNLISSSVT